MGKDFLEKYDTPDNKSFNKKPSRQKIHKKKGCLRNCFRQPL